MTTSKLLSSSLSALLEEDLKCSICTEMYENPKLLECGHVYCNECIRSMVNSLSQSLDWQGLIDLYPIKSAVERIKNYNNDLIPCACCQRATSADEFFDCKTCYMSVVVICSLCCLKDHKTHNFVSAARRLRTKNMQASRPKKFSESAQLKNFNASMQSYLQIRNEFYFRKQEPVKDNEKPTTAAKEQQNNSNEENKENNGGRMSHIPLAQGLLGGGAQGPRKQPKISAYMLLPGQGHRTSKRTFSETEPLSKDISVLNISTGTDIWIDEPEQQQPQAQRQEKNDLDQNYGLRASTKKATLTSMINLRKKVTGNGPHSKKISEKSDKNGSRWSRIRELVAATPNNTPEQMTQDLSMVESFLSTNCTVESPDIVYERNSRRFSTNTAINSSSVSENMEDANARFVEFLADAMKRIEAVRPDRVAAVRKVIKDALLMLSLKKKSSIERDVIEKTAKIYYLCGQKFKYN
uniref:RING-type domain-containing protein n=1 Tax=Ditylenchus dipsaci TaxID=166011 RepID=A0A915ERM6_9BILA